MFFRKKEEEEKAAASRRFLEEQEGEDTLKTENYLSAAEDMEEQVGEEVAYGSDVLRVNEPWKAKYVPLMFKIKTNIEPRQADTSPIEFKPISMPVRTGVSSI